MDDKEQKITRPRQIYMGENKSPYTPISKREADSEDDSAY
jgi:citrate synthase